MNPYHNLLGLLALTLAAGAAEALPAADLKLGGPEGLGFFAEKVRQHQPVTVSYIGGSITVGCGSSQYATNYYWKSRTALADAIAKRGGGKFTSTNAAIGGTGSGYGAFRVGAQVLDQNPDLLIVEFAVNDCPAKPAEARARVPDVVDGMEGIVRQALRRNPRMGIVFLYTSAAVFQRDYYAQGQVTPAVEAHHRVAQHYGCTEALTGSAIAAGLRAGTYTEKEFFPDGTHPADIGHALYAQALLEAVLPGLDQPAPAAPKALPPLLGSGHYEFARLDPIAPSAGAEGWTENRKQWNWAGVPIYTCATPGQPLAFPAKGQGIKLLFQGQVLLKWSAGDRAYTRNLNGATNMPFPALWQFPPEANPDGATITVEALPEAAGKTRGEVWGLFSIQAPQ